MCAVLDVLLSIQMYDIGSHMPHTHTCISELSTLSLDYRYKYLLESEMANYFLIYWKSYTQMIHHISFLLIGYRSILLETLQMYTRIPRPEQIKSEEYGMSGQKERKKDDFAHEIWTNIQHSAVCCPKNHRWRIGGTVKSKRFKI